MRKYSVIALILTLNTPIKASSVQVRPATLHDLENILQLDRDVTFEFFKPLYQTYYTDFPNGQMPDYFLNRELVEDEQAFKNAIYGENFNRLLVAQDMITAVVVGLLLFHKNSTILTLDLLLVDKKNRHQHIGKKLVQTALTTFDDIISWEVYPLRFGNDATLKFYESLGFINCGLGPVDKINFYGVSYADMYYFYKLTMHNQYRKPVHRKIAGRAG